MMLAKPIKKNALLNIYVQAFGISAACALCVFVPFLIIDSGFFTYCGDYNSQMVPFYMYVNDFLKSGNGQWSWETDLGSSIINSYSYYTLGSPFFWLTTLFPPSFSPFLMVPLLAIKFGTAGLFAYMYLKRYTKMHIAALIGSLLYSFSGFTVYNVFFYIFVDCIALFPILLWALDEFVYNKRRCVFAVAVAINCLNNYFFFVGQIVFLLIYFIVKLACNSYKISLKRFALLAFESLLGVLMAFILLWPSFLSVMQNPRTINLASGFRFLMYGNVQQYFAIFLSLFMPPDPAYIPSIYTEGVIKWTSLSAFLPVVSCVCVLAYMRARKKSPITHILKICFFMAFVPVLNSSFYALNSSYYARWYYMPILLMCCASMHVLESTAQPMQFLPADGGSMRFNVKSALKFVAIITFSTIVFGLVPTKVDDEWKIGAVNKAEQFWLLWLVAILGLLLFYIALRYKRGTRVFLKYCLVLIFGYSVLYSIVHVSLGKFPQWENDKDYREEMYVSAPAINWPDDGNFYRTDTYETHDNFSVWANKASLQFFHSTVTPSIMEFYPSVDVTRDVSSKPSHTDYALRGLLGVKYTIMPLDSAASFRDNYTGGGFEYAFTSGAFEIYENTNYAGMGFAYDNYITHEDFDEVFEGEKSKMLVHAVVLTSEQIEKYGTYLAPVNTDEFVINYDTYVADIEKHKQNAVRNFVATQHGFTCDIQLQEPKLVFLSVPYDEGFSATVNGEAVEIEKVSNGLSAVLCLQGENDIVFEYKTPGFDIGIIVSASAFFVLLMYVAFCFFTRKSKSSNNHDKSKHNATPFENKC